MPSRSLSIDVAPVLDMLASMLYVVFLELNESIENSTLSVVPVDHDKAEHLEMLQNKIFGVRCISYMFSVLWCVAVVLRCVLTVDRPFLFTRSRESEHVSELKPFSRSIPYVWLSDRAMAIKSAIRRFNKACAMSFPFLLTSIQV